MFWDDEQLQTCTIIAKDDKDTFNYESKSLLQLQIGKELEPNQFKKTNIFVDVPIKYKVLGTYDIDFSLKCGFWQSPFTFKTKRVEIIDKSPFKQFTLMSQQVEFAKGQLEFAKEQIDLLKEQLTELKMQRNETNQQFKVSLDYIIEQNKIAKNALYLAITLLIIEISFSIIGIFREEVGRYLKKQYKKILKKG